MLYVFLENLCRYSGEMWNAGMMWYCPSFHRGEWRAGKASWNHLIVIGHFVRREFNEIMPARHFHTCSYKFLNCLLKQPKDQYSVWHQTAKYLTPFSAGYMTRHVVFIHFYYVLGGGTLGRSNWDHLHKPKKFNHEETLFQANSGAKPCGLALPQNRIRC